MKLDKAIELLTAIVQTGEYEGDPDDSDAIKLGKEALSRLQTMRSYNINQAILPLPSERPIEDFAPSAERKRRLRESPLGREPKG